MHSSVLCSPACDSILHMNTKALRVLILAVSSLLFALPMTASAVGSAADAMCNPVTPVCSCGMIMGAHGCTAGPNKYLCTCSDTTNGGVTTGICIAPNKCLAQTSGGKGIDSGLSQLGQILGQVLGKLLQPSPPSPPASAPVSPTTPLGGCTGSTFQTSDITQLSNPCAQYVAPPANIPPPLGSPDTGSGCDALSQLLGTCGASSTPDITNDNVNTNTNTDTNTNPTTNVPVPPTSLTSVFSGTTTGGLGVPALLTPRGTSGTAGNIIFNGSGTTIFGSSQDVSSNTGVAGFYGSDTFGNTQPQGLAAQLCRSRPWAAGFLSAVLPTAFFDGLCSSNGYQVGTPPPPPPPPASSTPPVVQLQQSAPAPQQKAPTATTTPGPTVIAQVRIWAAPAAVPLDTRTSIFWSSQGVTNCTETSPDGSFNQNSLSGGAATVPITAATTFTISCVDSDGNPVTDSTTVSIAI